MSAARIPNLGDVGGPLRSGLAVFEETHEELSELQWAGLYALRQALRAHIDLEAYELAQRAQPPAGGSDA